MSSDSYDLDEVDKMSPREATEDLLKTEGWIAYYKVRRVLLRSKLGIANDEE